MLYSGREAVGERLLRECMSQDPDNKEAANALRMIKTAAKKKEEANTVFKNNEFESAIKLFDEAVALDPLNLNYNSILLHNKAIALTKLKKDNEAMKALNLCIKMQPKYAKALARRGDLKVAMKQFDEAVPDFAAAKEIDPSIKDIETKLKYAQQETKKAKKKADYYEVLGVKKDATEKEIKAAYRKKALEYHPDRNNDSQEQKDMAAKKFKEVGEAYAILSDPQKRKQHDMGANADDINSGHGGMGGFPGACTSTWEEWAEAWEAWVEWKISSKCSCKVEWARAWAVECQAVSVLEACLAREEAVAEVALVGCRQDSRSEVFDELYRP